MEDLRMLIKIKGIKMYQVADVIGISQDTLYRWLRKYDKDHHKKIMDAITKLSGGEQDDEIN